MDQGLLPRRYAKALYLTAVERNQQQSVYTLMTNLCNVFANLPDMSRAIANPFVNDSDKTALILSAAQADPAKDNTFADFIKLLEKNRRISIIHEIAIAYQDTYRKANNIYRVTVTAAIPLAEGDENRLKSLILTHLNGGSMEYSFKTDTDLIGGFTVNIDNEQLDASVRNELKQLRLNLLGQK